MRFFSYFILFLFSCVFLEAQTVQKADYVIVGGGTAGCVMARLLSDDPDTFVVLIHNGKNLTNDPKIKLTRNTFTTVISNLFGPPLSTTGQTTPQKHADMRTLDWAMGLPEGGCSSINAGAYCRGTQQLYEQWENLVGPLWSVDRILGNPALGITGIYEELETYHGDTNNPGYRGYEGPISVRQNEEPTDVSLKFTQALTNITGFPDILDYNDPLTPIGPSSRMQYTQSENGKLRVSSATFLNEAILGRKNLHVIFESVGLRTKISGNRATGVYYADNKRCHENFVEARKGVIVCAGVFSSAFLMHSGIGNEKMLHRVGIKPVFDNPNVGKGLADQPSSRMLFKTRCSDTPKFNSNRSVFAQISWLPDPLTSESASRQLRFATAIPSISGVNIPGIALGLFDLCQPKSRGKIYLKSNDPLEAPAIDLGLFKDRRDLDLFVRGYKVYIQGIVDQFKKIDPEYELLFPDPEILKSDDMLEDFLRATVASNDHFQSHCRMARSIGEGGVVDPTGRVFSSHGVFENLYVADNSVVPLCMDGSPMATAFLIPWNIARMIKDGE